MSRGNRGARAANFLAYHQSLATELTAVKDRVRNLIQHWPTDGAFKESALRIVLRRHLPETLQVGTGFNVSRCGECSTQIDLLIVDRSYPTLFKEGDLLIVTPSAVRAIIEVKTKLSQNKFQKVLDNVAKCKLLCWESLTYNKIFTGLFVYESAKNDQSKNLNRAVKKVNDAKLGYIDAISYGHDIFGMLHEWFELPDRPRLQNVWVLWRVPDMAPGYFISSILGKLLASAIIDDGEVWAPIQIGNNPIAYIDPQSNKFIQLPSSSP